MSKGTTPTTFEARKARERHLMLLAERNREAEAAYDKAMEAARLPGYRLDPAGVRRAVAAAFDRVIAAYSNRLWGAA